MLFGLVVAVFALFGFIFWLSMLIDCATKESSQSNDKLVWIIVIVFANFVGALVYYFVRRPQRFAADAVAKTAVWLNPDSENVFLESPRLQPRLVAAIQHCPACGIKMLPTSDGQCPSCHHAIA